VSATAWVILAGALATYLTRIGGHLVLSRFPVIHPRAAAALDAVPAAVLTALVAPTFVSGGWREALVLALAGLAALRLPMLGVLAFGWVGIVALRRLV